MIESEFLDLLSKQQQQQHLHQQHNEDSFVLLDETVHGYQIIIASGSAPSLRQWFRTLSEAIATLTTMPILMVTSILIRIAILFWCHYHNGNYSGTIVFTRPPYLEHYGADPQQ